MASSRVLVVVGDTVSGDELTASLGKLGATLSQVDLCFKPPPASATKFGSAIYLGQASDPAALGAISHVLVPSGTLLVSPIDGAPDSLIRTLVLSGYVDCSASGTAVTAKSPAYEVGSKASIQPKHKAAPAAAASKTWAIGVEDEGELLDDEMLLTEEDFKQPAKVAADDCEVGAAGRKACKNCTCGRADAENEPVKLTPDMLENPVSACGNCGLGDAFRCASCPYRGLPSFQPGKKIQLPSDFLTADA